MSGDVELLSVEDPLEKLLLRAGGYGRSCGGYRILFTVSSVSKLTLVGDEPFQDRPASDVPSALRPLMAFFRNHFLHHSWHLWRAVRRIPDEMESTSTGVPEKVLDEIRNLGGDGSSLFYGHRLLSQHVLTH